MGGECAGDYRGPVASSRRLVVNLGFGKLYVSKKYPDRYYFKAGFGDRNRKGLNHYVRLCDIPVEVLPNVIQWVSEEYEAALNNEISNHMGFQWNTIDEEYIRISLDLCYKELARRAKKS